MLNKENKSSWLLHNKPEANTAVQVCTSAVLYIVVACCLTVCLPVSSADSPPPSVLPTENIFGNAKMGYLAAKRIPEICGKLFCYCGCDLTDKHSSLLDCFTSDHGVDCNICQEEAILALQLQTQGKQLPEIQKAVDIKYVAEYNSTFEEPSESLKKYREQRLWKPTAAELANENTVGKTKSSTEKAPESSMQNCDIKTAGSTSNLKDSKSPDSKGSATHSTSSKSAMKKGGCCGHK